MTMMVGLLYADMRTQKKKAHDATLICPSASYSCVYVYDMVGMGSAASEVAEAASAGEQFKAAFV